MTAAHLESQVTEGVSSLEVRWIFPGQLTTAVAGWFGRFPARTEVREDAYLLDPYLRGLSVKLRGGRALEVKVYRGSPGLLETAGRARGRLEYWQKWSFPCDSPSQPGGDAAGWRPVSKRAGSAGSRWAASRPGRASLGWASSQGARGNSPRSTRARRPGGPWDWRQPAPPVRCSANSRPPQHSCSPSRCRAGWNSARMTPAPTRNGCPAPEPSLMSSHDGMDSVARSRPVGRRCMPNPKCRVRSLAVSGHQPGQVPPRAAHPDKEQDPADREPVISPPRPVHPRSSRLERLCGMAVEITSSG